jgi:nitrate reductase cytochrome c-type subunit
MDNLIALTVAEDGVGVGWCGSWSGEECCSGNRRICAGSRVQSLRSTLSTQDSQSGNEEEDEEHGVVVSVTLSVVLSRKGYRDQRFKQTSDGQRFSGLGRQFSRQEKVDDSRPKELGPLVPHELGSYQLQHGNMGRNVCCHELYQSREQPHQLPAPLLSSSLALARKGLTPAESRVHGCHLQSTHLTETAKDLLGDIGR